MKKKILFIMPSMFIGGAERSILGLFDSIDYEKYEVYLFLYRHEGEFLQYIPRQVILLPAVLEYATFDVPIKELLRSNHALFGLARIIGKVRLRIKKLNKKSEYGIWASMQYISRILQPLLPKISGRYDAAITFLGIPDTLINKVDAKVKVAWNHTDYSILGPDKDYDRKLYSQLNYIVSVSDACTDQFLSIYPEFQEKVATVGNILSKSLITKLSYEPISDMMKDNDEIVILSIGRFSEAKNFDNIPIICRMLRERGWNVKWYIIGYGGDEPLIRRRIAEAGMEDRVIILGKKENPYPYIKACDLYVQPSRYEGKAVTVREAQMLCKPVVITNYATSASQLEDGVDGVIVPLDNEGCAQGIISLLKNPSRMEQLSKNCSQRNYTNADEIKIIYKLVNGYENKDNNMP